MKNKYFNECNIDKRSIYDTIVYHIWNVFALIKVIYIGVDEILEELDIAYIEKIIFINKQNIPWSEVEQYLKKYVGNHYVVKESGDNIYIGCDFPEEFAESRYTKSL